MQRPSALRHLLFSLTCVLIAGAAAHGCAQATRTRLPSKQPSEHSAPARTDLRGAAADAAPPKQPGPLSALQQDAPDSAPPEAPDPALALPPPPDALAQQTPRLNLEQGDPVLPIRLMEGRRNVTFSPRGRMRMELSGEVRKTVEAPAGTTWKVRVARSTPARVVAYVQLGEFRFHDVSGLEEAQSELRKKALPTRVRTLGTVYGIAGKVIDNRKQLLLLDEALSPADAAARQTALLHKHGLKTLLFEEALAPATGVLEVLDDEDTVVALAENTIRVMTLGEEGFDVRQVEYGVGYDFHGFADRTYRGELLLTLDRNGGLAVVNRVGLEELLKGLVPSEIFARSHPEALKAQAVTARGEVLAKVGTKHLADPYLLCSEQHCAVYSGKSGEAESTNVAVEKTRGQALFSKEGRLVDSVYSAVCGGHTEHNDVVWGGIPDPNLRGRPDLLEPVRLPSPRTKLPAFLAAQLPTACRLSTLAQPSKYRWERRFTAAEVNGLTGPLGVGAVRALVVGERGVSGRARTLTVVGDRGKAQIRGELNIRRAFKMLNSAMFQVRVEKNRKGQPTAFVFEGGGWGHGVGLCQTGAIGRAEAGHDYRRILGHYFNDAQVSPLY